MVFPRIQSTVYCLPHHDFWQPNLAIRLECFAEAAFVHPSDSTVRDRAGELHAVASPIAHADGVRSDDVGDWWMGNLGNYEL